MKVIHCGDFRNRWDGLYIKLEDYNGIQYLVEDEYQDTLFSLCESGFTLDLNVHEVVSDE